MEFDRTVIIFWMILLALAAGHVVYDLCVPAL
jgi:hypothetical protein